MPQSLARLHIHLIFSTKNREPVLRDAIRDPLHRYMATVLQNFGCPPVLINSVADHVHILFELGRTVSVSKAVEEVKKTSSKWIKTQGNEYSAFAWQAGYGAFAVSESNVATVREYIAGQPAKNHSRKNTARFSNDTTWRSMKNMSGIKTPFQGLIKYGSIFPGRCPGLG